MNRLLLLLTIILITPVTIQATTNLDSLLSVLDKTVANRKVFTQKKEREIAILKEQYRSAGALAQQFSLLGNIFDLYSNFQTDSAYTVVNLRLKLANQMGQKAELAEAHMNLVEVYRNTGMYKEALETLEKVNAQGWNTEDLSYYYHLYHSIYVLMSDFAILDEDKKKYSTLVFNYKDSLLEVLNPNDMSYYLVSSSKHTMLGEYDEALDIANEALARFGASSPLVTYTLSEIYKYKGDLELEKAYLASSAISDLENGVKEYISLHRLAKLLNNEGHLRRVYSYLQCALEDAVFSNSRLRTLEVSKLLPLITESYNLKVNQERLRLIISLIVIGLLLIGLLIAFVFIFKQVKLLSSSRAKEKLMNNELKKVNNKLKEINAELSDANLVKEEYISSLFTTCSEYISKLEDFRVLVQRNIKTNQIKNLDKIVNSSTLVNDELKAFNLNFDTVFLNIYPTFIDEFNKLLEEEARIVPKGDDLLTPELRIYALVRLGINDSVKIAEFLHYSPQTIYNYRNRVRNKSHIPKGQFTTSVLRIGRD